VQSALVLGGVAYMLTVFGDEVDTQLDSEVDRVERDLDESFDEVRRSVREELDRRLPSGP
jgi:signal transduction histidine kinase